MNVSVGCQSIRILGFKVIVNEIETELLHDVAKWNNLLWLFFEFFDDELCWFEIFWLLKYNPLFVVSHLSSSSMKFLW